MFTKDDPSHVRQIQDFFVFFFGVWQCAHLAKLETYLKVSCKILPENLNVIAWQESTTYCWTAFGMTHFFCVDAWDISVSEPMWENLINLRGILKGFYFGIQAPGYPTENEHDPCFETKLFFLVPKLFFLTRNVISNQIFAMWHYLIHVFQNQDTKFMSMVKPIIVTKLSEETFIVYQFYCNVARENESFYLVYNHLCASMYAIQGYDYLTRVTYHLPLVINVVGGAIYHPTSATYNVGYGLWYGRTLLIHISAADVNVIKWG